ncbi:MAG: hypothetical protein EU529_00320 [Promethearchaeota archaeon]|nr:MAG: hypothetical protein EU529_00320 [Candidatus Lokiarchaeota archaeon]
MIYKVFLIDVDNGISLMEISFKEFQKKFKNNIFPGFFETINRTIDNIKEAMAKSESTNEMNRVLESEDTTFLIYYHHPSRVLICSVSDADDEIGQTKKALYKIGHRFWKKHRSDLKLFRETTEKKFQSFNADIENITFGGRISEVFPKLLVVESVLERILANGIITEFEHSVALQCNGKNSPLKISRMYPEKNRTEINEILKKLKKIDLIFF